MAKMKTSNVIQIALLMAITQAAIAVNMQTGEACEGDVLRLDCGQDFIKVWSALYGRANPSVCEDDEAAPLSAKCRADKSNFETIRHCDDKNSCEIKAESALFGDPCRDVKKYLQVKYYCRYHKHSECHARDSPTYNTKYACDDTDMVLECPNPGEVLKILDANYGRQGSNVDCTYRPGVDDLFCDDDTGETFEHVCLECRGKDECTIPVSATQFKDRCLGTHKYLSVQYVCIATETEEEEEDDDDDNDDRPRPGHSEVPVPNEAPPRRGHSDTIEPTTREPRRPRPDKPNNGFTLLKPGQGSVNVDGSIGSQDQLGGGETFRFDGQPFAPAPGSVNVGGSIGSQDQQGGGETFMFGNRGRPGAQGSNIYQGFIDQTRPDGSERTFTWGGKLATGITGLFQPFGVTPGSAEMLMKIIVSSDSSGQKFFTLQPIRQSLTTGSAAAGSAEYLMRIDTRKIQRYMQQFTFSQLIEQFNKGTTFYNGENEMDVPFQLTIGNGQKAFFSSIFQMVTQVDEQGQTVTMPTTPSSNFQLILEGGNQDIVNYLMTFANMNQKQRAEFIEHNLQIPLKVYNEKTSKIEDIKVPFYVNYNRFKTTLSQLFTTASKLARQFGMKFQITGEGGSKQLVTLPFTILEDQGTQMLFLTLPTCGAYKMYGFVADGEYLIDPDGINNGEQPFVVNCQMEKGKTVISHNRRESTVASYPAGKDRLDYDIVYDGATNAQLTALRTISEACRQEISHECVKKSVHFVDGAARIWWEGLDGARRENWGGAETNVSKCHCGTKQECLIQENVCNCDDGEGTSDWGALTDKDTLPVSKVVFERPAAEQGQDKLKVGDFKCIGDQSSSTLQFFIMLAQMMASPRKTCDDYKKDGYELDGIYLIDPDGNGGEKPFTVFCEMEKQQQGITVIHQQLSNQRTIVNNAEAPGSYSMDIHYKATMRQIANLKYVSGYCDQSLTYECQGSAFHTGDVLNHWWVSFDNETMPNWGGAPCDFNGCSCKTNSSCVDNLLCNCDKDDKVLRTDLGVLDDKDKLPVTQLRFGDTGGSDEFGYYTLGPLQCWDTSGKVPPPHASNLHSCAEIKKDDVAARSGNYYITPPPTTQRFLVYCDMSDPEGVTIVYPNSGETMIIDGFYEEPGTWSRKISYGPSEKQLRSLTAESASCQQFISHGCHGSLHHDPDNSVDAYTWWESRNGEKMTYWGDVTEGCQCYKDKTCLGGQDKRCNCDVNSQSLNYDEGYLRDKARLPVSAIRSGDVSDDKGYEYGTARLGPLMCEGNQAQVATGRQLQTEPACETFVTDARDSFHTLPDKQDLSKFEFSLQTSGMASLKLSPYKKDTAYYLIVIGHLGEVTFMRCDADENCSDSQSKSYPPSSSQIREFTVVYKDPELQLTQGGESLTFKDKELRGLGLEVFAFKTTGADGTWQFGSNCQDDVISMDICNNQVRKVSCSEQRVHVVAAAFGRMANDVCPVPGTQATQPVCFEDVTSHLQKKPLCINADKTCFFHSSLNKYRREFRDKDCLPEHGYLHLEYRCSNTPASSRTLESCDRPCLNGGECVPSSDDESRSVCRCHVLFQGEHCETEVITCSALGDPHYKDFAGRKFDFQGNCTYVLVQDCKSEPLFEVHVVNKSPLHNTAVSSTAEVIVTFNGMVIHFTEGKAVKVDGEEIESATMIGPGFQMIDKGTYVILTVPAYTLTVTWNYKDIVKVTLPKNGQAVCGLCGNTNADPQDDTHVMKSGQPEKDLVVFGNSWQVDTDCTANTHPSNAAQSNKAPDRGRQVVAARFCKAISATDAPFDKCPITAANADSQRQSCEFDRMHKSREDACMIIKDYQQECERENKAEVFFLDDDWLEKNTQCGTSCPAHLSHEPCIGRCDTTCALLRLSTADCDVGCESGCVCLDELYDNGDACVPEDSCGCAYNGRYYKLGYKLMDSSCDEECVCMENNTMQCEDPPNKLCPIYHTDFLSTCELTDDGIFECVCIGGYEPNEDGTACKAISMPDMVTPSGRRRRRRDVTAEDCNVKLGMTAGHIPDSQITASSSKDENSQAKHVRPGLTGWMAQTDNTDQWIKVDIGIPTEITGLITLGGHQDVLGSVKLAWVTAYSVDVSLDGQEWTAMHDAKRHVQFNGNSDSDTPVTNMFAEMMHTRYIRVNPMSWHEGISLRLEVIGCKQLCDAEIGSFPVTRHISSDNWFVVNAGEPINCAGHVTGWKVVHAREEPLVAWVLRPVKASPGSYLLVGRAHIPAGPVDKEVQYDLNEQRIPVQSGDVVGFLYERNPLYSSESGDETTDFLWVNLRDIPNYETTKAGSTVRFMGGQGPRAFSAVAVLEPSNGAPVSSVQCSKEVGLNQDNILVPNEAFTASSHVKGHKPERARLNTLYNHRRMKSGWTPRRRDNHPYLQVDLGGQYQVTGIVTQGRHEQVGRNDRTRPWLRRGRGGRRGQRRRRPGNWVTAYYVQYSQDCDHWVYVRKGNGQWKRFSGNVDQNGARTNYLDQPITARCIRIRPNRYHKKIGLRVELIGCSNDPCLNNPCERGMCRRASGLNEDGYVCKCPEGWTGTKCETAEGLCRSASNSYYHTFDGYHFYFPGECTYTLVKDCDSSDHPLFDVLTNNAATGREIYIYTNDMSFELKQEGIVRVDGEACKLPIKRNGVSIIHNAYTGVLLQTSYGLYVEWDGHHRVIVGLPASYAGKVCGLCGNFDGDLGNEIPQDADEMQYAQSFTVDPESCGTCEKCAMPLPCDQDPSRDQQAQAMCYPIIDPSGPFAGCHGTVDPSTAYGDCLQDVCASDAFSRVPRCTHLSEYADICASNGIIITSWRKKNLCGITCPAGMIYTPCGSACPATCGDPHAPHTCTRPCEETCQCPEGYLKEGNKLCLLPSQCGCTDNGCYFEGGASFYRYGCLERGMCGINGEVSYSTTQCGLNATCQSRDGIYGCFCDEGFSGDGITCADIEADTALLVCEGDIVDLYCGPGSHVDVVEVMYGRRDDFEKCPTDKQPLGECLAESAMSVAVAICQGKESCHLTVSSEVFGDPCYGVNKYLEIDYQCTLEPQPKTTSEETMKRVCQGDAMEIECGGAYIEIVDALYGRLTDGQVCPGGSIESVDCLASTSLAVVQQLCHGQHKCTGLHASNYFFGGNPCLKTFKYLEVRYKCSLSVVPQADLPANPCDKKPCLNSGQCVVVNTVKGYKCSCPHDWTGPNCEFEEVSCRASGISHILDFNEQRFEFLGDSKYDFAASCPGNEHAFRVMIKKARSPLKNEVSAIEAVHVHYDSKVIELKQEHRVILDGKKVSDTMTLNFGSIKLCRVGNYLVLRTDFGMIVAWDGLHRVQVRLPDSVARLTCGLCGTYRGLTSEKPGFIDRDGNKVDDVNTFGSSWRVVADEPSFVHTNLINVHACAMWPNLAYEAAEVHCAELKNELGLFRSCFSKVNPQPFYQSCVYDMCATLPSQEFLCQALAEYADACLDAGIILDNWRSTFKGGQCKLACPVGQVYSACVQSCPKSCGDPHAENEPMDRCYEGCVCQNSADFQDDDQCLTPSNCGCKRFGIYYQPEERVVTDQCTGQFVCLPGGDWTENPLTCDPNAHCGVVEHRQGCICDANYAGNGKQCFDSRHQDVNNKVVSQGEVLHIDCGDQFVDVLSADYSYTDRSSAGATTDPDCRAGNAMDVLANHLVKSGNVLQVTPSAYTFGETCSQTGNVLTVDYVCSGQPVVREWEPGKVVHMRACEDREIELKCRKGSRMTILKAGYGRLTGSEMCHSQHKGLLTTSCRARQDHIMRKLRKHCQGREQCSLHVAWKLLRTDPCPGTSKYLDVTYKCEVFEPN